MTALKAPCQHGRYEPHAFDYRPYPDSPAWGECPGGSLLPPDSLVVVKEDGSWPAWPLAWISDLLGGTPNMREDLEPLLDALAAAQPGRET